MSQTRTMTLTEFLLARIADDDLLARRHLHIDTDFWPHRMLAECAAKRRIVLEAGDQIRAYDLHPETGDPVRDEAVLGAANNAERVLRHLASVYSDHPDYHDEWVA